MSQSAGTTLHLELKKHERSITIFIMMWLGIRLFSPTTKFNCAVNNIKSLPKIHHVGKQSHANGGGTRLRERDINLSKEPSNPV